MTDPFLTRRFALAALATSFAICCYQPLTASAQESCTGKAVTSGCTVNGTTSTRCIGSAGKDTITG